MPALYRSAKMLARKWDGEFESGLLQRRVGCELPSNQGIFENYRMEFEKLQRQKQTPGFGFVFGLNEASVA